MKHQNRRNCPGCQHQWNKWNTISRIAEAVRAGNTSGIGGTAFPGGNRNCPGAIEEGARKFSRMRNFSGTENLPWPPMAVKLIVSKLQ